MAALAQGRADMEEGAQERIRRVQDIWQAFSCDPASVLDAVGNEEKDGLRLFYTAILLLFQSKGEFTHDFRVFIDRAVEAEPDNLLFKATQVYMQHRKFVGSSPTSESGSSKRETNPLA